ncbi:MAG: outer membrane protein [Xanthobacteraceae bacterium]|jgi:outer membrane immunogenic protein
MNKLLFLGATALALTVAGPALAADLTPYPVKAPFVERFTWTGCYLGGHVGGAFESRDATDPAALIENNLGGASTGTTTAHVSPSGLTLGGQIGCDYQFSPNWVAGIEGAASAGYMKGTTNVALNTGDSEALTIKTDLMTAVTARLGYAMDHWLFYAKGGVAWTNDKYSITGTFLGTPFDAEGLGNRVGWTAGAGVEWAFAQDWSARLEYDYYDFGTQAVNMIDAGNNYMGLVNYRQTTQTVKLGLNFHVWGWQ